jgi:hypothetical protein
MRRSVERISDGSVNKFLVAAGIPVGANHPTTRVFATLLLDRSGTTIALGQQPIRETARSPM